MSIHTEFGICGGFKYRLHKKKYSTDRVNVNWRAYTNYTIEQCKVSSILCYIDFQLLKST